MFSDSVQHSPLHSLRIWFVWLLGIGCCVYVRVEAMKLIRIFPLVPLREYFGVPITS